MLIFLPLVLSFMGKVTNVGNLNDLLFCARKKNKELMSFKGHYC